MNMCTQWTLGSGMHMTMWNRFYNWVIDCMNMPVEDCIKSKPWSEKEFTDQHSSHFKLCIALNFKSLQEKYEKFDI